MITCGFVSRKGGSGKSTICCNLAIAAAADGKKVVVIDADSGLDSSAEFFELRGKDDVVCEKLGKRDIYKLAASYFEKKFDYCFVDVGGWDAADTRIVATFCGVVVVPIVPSGFFYRGADKTIAWLKELKAERVQQGSTVLVLTKAKRNTIALREMSEAVKGFDLPTFQTVLYERSDYTNADLAGKGVTEYKSCQAGGEIRRLLAEINEME